MGRVFGKRLHNQIVLPLMLASVVVACVATVLAVWWIQHIIDEWVASMAVSASNAMTAGFMERVDDLQRHADMLAADTKVTTAIENSDRVMLNGVLVEANQSIKTDAVMLLDDEGCLLAINGGLPFQPGDTPLPERNLRFARLGMAYPCFIRLEDREILCAFQPVWDSEGQTYILILVELLDDDFLQDAAGDVEHVYYVYDDRLRRVAKTAELGEVKQAGVESVIHPGGAGKAREPQWLRMQDSSYRVWTTDLTFREQDPTGSHTYLLTFVSSVVASEAGATTMRLILMWSAVAVLVLIGLGAFVARTVSAPLLDLTKGAQRVAEGDFSSKVIVSGSNELTELGESFNQMTDSLKDRTENLTKKVLELATLYEMSRALGSTLDLDRLLESVLDSAIRIFNVESGYVILREKDSGHLEARAWRGTESRPDEQAVRSSMSEWVIRESRPLVFNPQRDEDGGQRTDSVTGALAALCVPLVSGEGVIGAMTVGSRDPEFRFSNDDVRLLSTIANHATIAIGNIELFSSLQEAYIATVRSLAAAVDAKDAYTRGHSDKVALYSMAMAVEMNLSTEQRIALEMAAYLHDIGKIGVREEILLKPGRLDDDEMGQMRHHPLIGANILKPVAFPWPIAPIVRHHHEHWDGSGYPAGLRGEEIPLLARILAAADAYEAMTSDRPYRRSRTRDEAVAEMRRCAGTQFDPAVVEALLGAIDADSAVESAVSEHVGGDMQHDEARAIFVAVCDGMFASFRRLGGPRLASNLELDVNGYFRDTGTPFRLSSGHLSARWDESEGGASELEQMRATVAFIANCIERTSGHGLVDNFYAEALSEMSGRMRRLAGGLRLHDIA